MKRIVCFIFLTLLFCGSIAFAEDSTEVLMLDQQKVSLLENLTSPKNMANQDEDISTFSGELNFKVTELSLPGKNGHDLVIKREHRTNQAELTYSAEYDYDTTVANNIRYTNLSFVYRSERGLSYNILFDSEAEMLRQAASEFYVVPDFADRGRIVDRVTYYKYENIVASADTEGAVLLTRKIYIEGKEVTLFARKYMHVNSQVNPFYMDYDWTYNIPVVVENSADRTDNNDKDSYLAFESEQWYNGFMRDYAGNIIEICWGNKKENDGSWNPYYFDSKHNTGIGYKFNYISVEDITQNGLTYNRTITDTMGRIHYINASNKLIACEDKYGNRILYNDGVIIDTFGRRITINADGITVTSADYSVPVVRYTREAINNEQLDPCDFLDADDTYILKVCNANNQITEYSYQLQDLLFDADHFTGYLDVIDSATSYGFTTDTYLLTNITYSNGDTKNYTYERNARYSCYWGTQTKYKVCTTYDLINGKRTNEYSFQYENPDEGYPGVGTSTTVVTYGEAKYTDFYPDHRQARKSYRKYEGTNTPIRTINYEYAQISGERYYIKSESSLEGDYLTVSTSNYDDNYNLIEESDGIYTATYTYDPTYNIMLTKTYNQDADTVIRLENTLTEDKKDVATSKVYENDVLVGQTDYEYPIYENGYGINTNVWKEDINHNDIKDENEGVLTENYYIHDSAYFVDELLDHYIFTYDIADADGTNQELHSYVTGYDLLGNIIAVEDGNYNFLMFERDLTGRPVVQYNPDSTTQTIVYNDTENSVIHTNESGEKIKTFYNIYGQITAQYSMVDNEWVLCLENFYNERGLISQNIVYRSADTDDKIITDYKYYANDRISEIMTSHNYNCVSKYFFRYDFKADYYTVTIITDGDNSITPATKKEYYDTVGNLVKEELVSGNKTLATTYTYDKVGNVLTVTDPNGNTTTSTYDYANRLLTQTNPQGATVTNAYDKGGRLIATTDAMGNQSTFRYDNLDRVIEKTVPLNDSETAKHKYYYDMNSNLISEKVLTQAENGTESYQETSYTYNTRDFLTDTTVGGLLQTAYEYDPAGRTTKMMVGSTNPQITEYSYNELGQLTAVTAPDGTVETYQNDFLGNVLSKTDRNGIVTATVYNGQNLPVLVTATKEGVAETVRYDYDVLGNIISANSNTGIMTFFYDDFGRLIREKLPNNISNFYTYDDNGNRLSYLMKIDGIEKINTAYTYNNLNQLTQVNNNGIITTYNYDANGNLLTETTGDNISTFTYDNANRMTGMVNAYGDTPRETETYTYYPNGNKKSVTDTAGKLTQYTYDNAGRLTAETVDGVATSYTYDGYNNRIGKVENDVQTSYLYDNRNRLTKEMVTENGQTAVTSYQYDPNGNLYSKQTLTYGDNTIQTPEVSAVLMGYTADTNDMLLEYNNFNQLTMVTKGNEIISYDYYANGMRQSKTVDGVTTTHIWDGQNMVGEITGDNFTGYLRGARLIARKMGDNTQYYHFNGHGDTLSMTDENGVVLQNYTYDAFGNLENPHGLDTNPFRYCGEYFDQETGFIYLRARYYSPEIGRFISEDPIRDGVNWYAYCGNNPVMFVDPTGMIVTAWDEENCSREDLMKLRENDKLWGSGNAEQKKKAADDSYKIRSKYIKENEELLLDGRVEAYYTDTVTAYSSKSNISVTSSISYKRIYDEKTYLQLLKVKVSITPNNGAILHSTHLDIGQTAIGCSSQTLSVNINEREFEYSPNWNPIYDDGGAGYSRLGIAVTLDLYIPRSKTNSEIILFNQVYDHSIVEDGMTTNEDFDLLDVLREGLQRGER